MAMGVDETVSSALIGDRHYMRLQILAAAIDTYGIEEDDRPPLVSQAIDGDTAQVGPSDCWEKHLPQVGICQEVTKEGETSSSRECSKTDICS